MTELLSLTPLEYILIGLVVMGIFLFFRACWHNIRQGSKAFTDKHVRDIDTSS